MPACRSIIILANDAHPQQSDAALIRVVLSLMVMHLELQSRGGGLKVCGHVVFTLARATCLHRRSSGTGSKVQRCDQSSDTRRTRLALQCAAPSVTFPCSLCTRYLQGHIVAEACHRDHRDLLLHLGYSRMLHTVVPHDLSARLMVQCARHPQVKEKHYSCCFRHETCTSHSLWGAHNRSVSDLWVFSSYKANRPDRDRMALGCSV